MLGTYNLDYQESERVKERWTILLPVYNNLIHRRVGAYIGLILIHVCNAFRIRDYRTVILCLKFVSV